MPIYHFKCPKCLFELVAMARMSSEKRCPDCDAVLQRVPVYYEPLITGYVENFGSWDEAA